MSIATDVSRIKGNITAALAAIADKGVTVPDGSTSDALAGLIASIEAGGGTEINPFESIKCGTFTSSAKTITIDGASSCKMLAIRRTSTDSTECTVGALLFKKATGTAYGGTSMCLDIMGNDVPGQLFPIISGDTITFYKKLSGTYEYVMVS